MGSPERHEDEKRTRAIPVSYHASKQALDEVSGKTVQEINLIDGSNPIVEAFDQDKIGFAEKITYETLALSYTYAGGIMFQDQIHDQARGRMLGIWRKGLVAFFRASQLTAEKADIPLPHLHGEFLDVYEASLTNPHTFQDERRKEKEFKDLALLEQEEDKSSIKALILPGTRMPKSREHRRALYVAMGERVKTANLQESHFVQAVRENVPFEDTDELRYFLAPASILHDLYTLHYEYEEFKAITGMS